MQIFEKLITVTKNDLDELNHVNNVRYVQWINDVAKEHWYKKATQEMLDNYFWVVLKHQINYKSSAYLNETLKLKTYITLSKGVMSTRVVEIYNHKNNTLLTKSETNFCLISSTSNKPARITQEISDLFS